MTTDTYNPLEAEATLPQPVAPPPTRKPRGPSVARIVTGAIVGIAAAAIALGGGAVLLVDGEKDANGFFMTDDHAYVAAPGTAALRTESADIDLDGAEWLVDSSDLGDIKLRVSSENGKPVFAGVAKTKDVEKYLDGVATTTLTDVEFGPFDPTYDTSAGRRRAERPRQQPFWAATTGRDGELNWRVDDGDWTVVVMNEDGSADVRASVEAGANVPILDDIGWVLLAIGGLGLVGAAALIATGATRR